MLALIRIDLSNSGLPCPQPRPWVPSPGRGRALMAWRGGLRTRPGSQEGAECFENSAGASDVSHLSKRSLTVCAVDMLGAKSDDLLLRQPQAPRQRPQSDQPAAPGAVDWAKGRLGSAIKVLWPLLFLAAHTPQCAALLSAAISCLTLLSPLAAREKHEEHADAAAAAFAWSLTSISFARCGRSGSAVPTACTQNVVVQTPPPPFLDAPTTPRPWFSALLSDAAVEEGLSPSASTWTVAVSVAGLPHRHRVRSSVLGAQRVRSCHPSTPGPRPVAGPLLGSVQRPAAWRRMRYAHHSSARYPPATRFSWPVDGYMQPQLMESHGRLSPAAAFQLSFSDMPWP
ncbi:hypothetical protein EJ04DRAFT_304513 [Polyplosphaeria fusca]|uniref:Uncharacterized protein n=1 Tax=Polyplosphaeria fusca TaxID=682080 RepID=A0A9P4QS03_9PLEO|nr:hypothetical protein EJ04DRAFT_304513 [Polyplosphaeria fusca]